MEDLSGLGQIYKHDKSIASVLYLLRIEPKEEEHDVAAADTDDTDGQHIFGPHNISGQITVLKGERYLKDIGELTLELDNGLKIQFHISTGNPKSGTYLMAISEDATASS